LHRGSTTESIIEPSQEFAIVREVDGGLPGERRYRWVD